MAIVQSRDSIETQNYQLLEIPFLCASKEKQNQTTTELSHNVYNVFKVEF